MRVPITLLGVAAFVSLYFFGADDSFLRKLWPFCILLGVTCQVFGDFLLNHGRWVVGDVSRIAGFFIVNLGMVLCLAWAWTSGEEAWFWYVTLLYGSLLILLLGWNSRDSRGDSRSGPRVR
ncbi:hypothetical protein BH20ACT10_BH20ACT10_02230 [soil metagenome]